MNSYASFKFGITQNQQFCAFFLNEGHVYRIFAECESVSREPTCSLFSPAALATQSNPVICESNSTCDLSVSNGFIIAGESHKNPLNLSSTITLLKGIKGESEKICKLDKVFHLDENGFYEPNFTIPYIQCKAPNDPIIISVILIFVLILFFSGSAIFYFVCRPKHDLNSDETIPISSHWLNQLMYDERCITAPFASEVKPIN